MGKKSKSRYPKGNNRKQMSSKTKASGFKDTQLTLLNQKFRSKQKLSPSEVKLVARDTKLSEKQVRTWFTNKRRNCSQKKIQNSSVFSKVPKVSVLMDMNTIKALQRSLAGTENILKEEENESFESTSLSEKIPSLDQEDKAVKEIQNVGIFQQKKCIKTNKYIEKLLQRVEELEEGLKEREGEIYFMQKDISRSREDLEAKDRVLRTIQQSIPKVVSDHRKNIEVKDMKILELENRLQLSERGNTELRLELENIRKTGKCSEDKEELDTLKNKNSEYQQNLLELERNLAQKEKVLEKNVELEKSIRVLEQEKVTLTAEIEKKSRELNLVRYKERQCLQLERTLSETRKMLDECKAENKELQMKESQSAEKISQLEFEKHSQSVELNTLGEVIKRLNDKVRTP